MRVDCALLCDAVSAREGLLNILGGGITRLRRPEFPAPLGAGLALRIMLHPTEADREHNLEARLLAEDGEQVGKVEISFGVESKGDVRPGEELAAVFGLPLHTVGLPRPGAYSFELLIDGIHGGSVAFVSEHAPEE